MTLAGGILILITIISSFLIVAVAPYIKIVTNNYFFWLALGLLLLVYLITFRFADE
jgi:accessory gene regulator protein AgrB